MLNILSSWDHNSIFAAMTLKGYIFILFITIIPLIALSRDPGHILRNDFNRDFDSTAVTGFHYFKTKGILFDSTSNAALYNEVYGWLGVPYRWGGMTKAGADCSGFASAVYKNVYSFNVGGSAGDIYKMLTPVEKTDLKEGDLVFFKINRTYISHVGIYLSNNKFIHETSWGHGVMISDLNDAYYTLYYFSAGRIPSGDSDDISDPSENQPPKQ